MIVKIHCGKKYANKAVQTQPKTGADVKKELGEPDLEQISYFYLVLDGYTSLPAICEPPTAGCNLMKVRRSVELQL